MIEVKNEEIDRDLKENCDRINDQGLKVIFDSAMISKDSLSKTISDIINDKV